MMIKIASCLLTLGFLAACTSTTTTAKRETLRERNARYASNQSASTNPNEPAAPAEGPGPEDVPATGSMHPEQNPALVPLFRDNAAGDP
jgi:hypothetical protein